MKFPNYFLVMILFYILANAGCSPEKSKVENIYLDIPLSSLKQLEQVRKTALSRGILMSDDNRYVPAIIRWAGKKIPVDIRLKGDWTDHLENKKWSFRVKVKNGYAISGMRTFSLQSPQRRHFLEEWLLHKWMRDEDVPALRYIFRSLKVNGSSWGLYVIEEHFDRQLPESMERREGPIVKFEEDGFWELQLFIKDKEEKPWIITPEFESADIRPFKKGRTWKDETLRKQFFAAQALMDDFRYSKRPASEIFDIDVTAKFFAILDVCNSYHTLRWHNMRFYFNPVTGLLEPVAFDNYTEQGSYKWFAKPFLGFATDTLQNTYFRMEYAVFHLFHDEKFVAKYKNYLKKYADETYVRTLLENYKDEIITLSEVIEKEFNWYIFDGNSLLGRARYLSDLLDDDVARPFDMNLKVGEYGDDVNTHPVHFREMALKANTLGLSTVEREVGLRNFHLEPVEVIGFNEKPELPYQKTDSVIMLGAYQFKPRPPLKKIVLPSTMRYLFYRIKSDTAVFVKKISKWPAPDSVGAFAGMQNSDEGIFRKEGNTWTIGEGRYSVSSPLIIPEGKEFVLEAGAEIDFVEGSYLISYSPVITRGSADRMSVIRSSDNSGRGFHLLSADGRSVFRNVLFSDLNTLEGPRHFFTGGVTVYRSKVRFENCQFRFSRSEDALNIINSDEFRLENVVVEAALADGIDLDFSIGELNKITVKEIGNDGIDISGGKVKISRSGGESIADKAITIGEASESELNALNFKQCGVGLAIKDGSKVNGHDISISSGQCGVTAFVKKPEYCELPMEIAFTDLKLSGFDDPFLLDSSITLVTDGQLVKGRKKLDIEALFYNKKTANELF